MLPIRIKEGSNDVWINLEHVTHVRPCKIVKVGPNHPDQATQDALDVHFVGTPSVVLEGWSTDKWDALIAEIGRKMSSTRLLPGVIDHRR